MQFRDQRDLPAGVNSEKSTERRQRYGVHLADSNWLELRILVIYTRRGRVVCVDAEVEGELMSSGRRLIDH